MLPDFFYSDPHFGHKNIIKYENRPFTSLEDMREKMIDLYNQCVLPRQTCLWLGDAFFTSFAEAKEILSRMNGTKVIVRGNHDKKAVWLVRAGFEIAVNRWVHLRIADAPVRACHYPYWRGEGKDSEFRDLFPEKRRGEFLVHGHVHGKTKVLGNQIHIGVDAREYEPVHVEEVAEDIRRINDLSKG